ncbi:MAG: OmpA family protein [Paludibacteraceae bacterium]|nr:OmpA family protein [Paludibacteraceae bacterium]
MPNKVRVYGKAQNRTVLGIVNAYLVMYPHATKADLEKAFPLELQDGGSWNSLFCTPAEWKKKNESNQGLWFAEKDEILHLQDGTELILLKLWPKENFDKIVSHAKMYDIEIAKFEAADKGFGAKGGYRLEYLNGYVPPKPGKKSNKWLWILLAALLIIAILIILLLMRGCNKQEPQIVEVEKVVVVHDTLYIQEIEEIEKNFNAAEFVQGKADLSESAKFVLHDLAKVMQKNPEVRLLLEGHTSAEGDAAFNQKLSEARAQAAVAFLIEHEGIDASRLEAVGKGSSELKNPENPMAPENRRTEFIVLE